MRCGAMLSAGSQSLALALEDVSQRWLLARAVSQRWAISAWLSALALSQRTLISLNNLTINYDINYDDVSGIDTEW